MRQLESAQVEKIAESFSFALPLKDQRHTPNQPNYSELIQLIGSTEKSVTGTNNTDLMTKLQLFEQFGSPEESMAAKRALKSLAPAFKREFDKRKWQGRGGDFDFGKNSLGGYQ